MSVSPPHLPLELIDHIIDQISASQEHHTRQLSCLALVARRCRNRVNSHRFSRILFHRYSSTARIHGLVTLLKHNAWEQYEGLAHHITSIFLSLAASRRDGNYFPHCTFEDGSIATLLRLVFRGVGYSSSSKGSYSLSMWNLLPNSPDTGTKAVDFTKLGPDMTEALHDLCFNSYITEIRLAYLFNVPRTLLASSRITHLFLQNVHFSLVEISPSKLVTTNPLLRELKSLSLKSSPTFLDAARIPPDNMIILPAMTELQLTLKDQNDFRTLSSLGKYLVALELTIDPDSSLPSSSVDYTPLLALQRMRIIMSRVYNPTAESDVTTQSQRPLFLDIYHLLPRSIPSDLSIDITVHNDCYHLFSMWHDSIDELYLRIQHQSLQALLEDTCSSSAVYIKIMLRISIACQDNVFDISAFEEECAVYARQLFSGLDKISGLTLVIAISIGFTSV